jgi:uncharacterized protein YdhG (YjbR/CyaY superfamily)
MDNTSLKSEGTMRTKQAPARNIDEYIAGFPPDVQEKLQGIRATIRKAAPELQEAIKYQIPTFTLNANVIFFAAFKDHISVYPAPRGSKEFKEELSRYAGGTGTVQFPLDEPMPFDLITRMAKFRVQEDEAAAKAKRKKKQKR